MRCNHIFNWRQSVITKIFVKFCLFPQDEEITKLSNPNFRKENMHFNYQRGQYLSISNIYSNNKIKILWIFKSKQN